MVKLQEPLPISLTHGHSRLGQKVNEALLQPLIQMWNFWIQKLNTAANTNTAETQSLEISEQPHKGYVHLLDIYGQVWLHPKSIRFIWTNLPSEWNLKPQKNSQAYNSFPGSWSWCEKSLKHFDPRHVFELKLWAEVTISTPTFMHSEEVCCGADCYHGYLDVHLPHIGPTSVSSEEVLLSSKERWGSAQIN